jgi:hypothetical protein
MLKIAAFLVLVSSVANAAEWYAGGTLHKANVAEWSGATPENKLATAADWTVSIIGTRKTQSMGMDQVRVLASSLVECVDVSTKGVEQDVATTSVTELAAACAILMGWTQ